MRITMLSEGMAGWARGALGVGLLVLSACGPGGTGTDAASGQDAAAEGSSSLCGASGVYGTFANVMGGQSGVQACGRTLAAFTSGTITIAQGSSATSALLTVSGTGNVGDTTNCVVMVDGCTVTGAACPSGGTAGGVTVNYTLRVLGDSVSGTAGPTITTSGGDSCSVHYSIDSGSR